jgi:hypothetical protein
MGTEVGRAGKGAVRGRIAGLALLGLGELVACDHRNALAIWGPDAAPDGPVCRTIEQDLTHYPAELVVVLDRSRSMGRQLAGQGATLWQEVTAALDQTAASASDAVRFGLKLFPSVAGCDVAEGVEVAPQDDPAAMRSVLRTALPAGEGGGSPVQLAIRRAADYVGLHRTEKLQYLLLATDGAPTCGGGSNSNDTDGTVQALADAAAQGLHTFVVGIAVAGSRQQTALNQMAVAGGEPRAGATQYYSALDRAEIDAALAPIVSYVSCSIPLPTAAGESDPIAVAVDGQAVPPGDADGWRLNQGRDSVTLSGSWCQRIRSHDAEKVILKVACE